MYAWRHSRSSMHPIFSHLRGLPLPDTLESLPRLKGPRPTQQPTLNPKYIITTSSLHLSHHPTTPPTEALGAGAMPSLPLPQPWAQEHQRGNLAMAPPCGSRRHVSTVSARPSLLSILVKNGRNNGGSGENVSLLYEFVRDGREEGGEDVGFCAVVYHCRLKQKTGSDSITSLPVQW
jgi:hypothetical protein